MARTRRGDGEAFDNIIAGNAITNIERTIAGAAPPAELTIWEDNIIVGVTLSNSVRADNYIQGTATPVLENVRAGG